MNVQSIDEMIRNFRGNLYKNSIVSEIDKTFLPPNSSMS